MSYVFLKILLCLLLAGVIGLVIGWFFRGGCKKSLLENDNQWKDKMKSLTNAHDITLENKEHQVATLTNNINLAKSNYQDMESRFIALKATTQKYEIYLNEKKNKTESLKKAYESLNSELKIAKKKIMDEESALIECQKRLSTQSQEDKSQEIARLKKQLYNAESDATQREFDLNVQLSQLQKQIDSSDFSLQKVTHDKSEKEDDSSRKKD